MHWNDNDLSCLTSLILGDFDSLFNQSLVLCRREPSIRRAAVSVGFGAGDDAHLHHRIGTARRQLCAMRSQTLHRTSAAGWHIAAILCHVGGASLSLILACGDKLRRGRRSCHSNSRPRTGRHRAHRPGRCGQDQQKTGKCEFRTHDTSPIKRSVFVRSMFRTRGARNSQKSSISRSRRQTADGPGGQSGQPGPICAALPAPRFARAELPAGRDFATAGGGREQFRKTYVLPFDKRKFLIPARTRVLFSGRANGQGRSGAKIVRLGAAGSTSYERRAGEQFRRFQQGDRGAQPGRQCRGNRRIRSCARSRRSRPQPSVCRPIRPRESLSGPQTIHRCGRWWSYKVLVPLPARGCATCAGDNGLSVISPVDC